MEVELTDHLGYEPHREPPGGVGNTRNGSTSKTLLTDHGRDGGSVQRKACYLALAIGMDGERDVLGLQSKPTRVPSSGCRSSPTSSNAASRTS